MKYSEYFKKITLISTQLDQLGLLTDLVRKYNYPDEVQIYQYNNTINSIKHLTDGEDLEITAGGYSFTSSPLALLKCLMETGERLAASCYRKKSFIISSTKGLKPIIDPNKYKTNAGISDKIFSWVAGTNFINSKKVYIPAQCVYYSYKYLQGEPHLTSRNSTGAAGGFDHESTLLRGIYEIVERDAFMSIYLAQIKAPKIEIKTIKDKKILNILDMCQRYNLDLMLFDLTTDLGIPVYLGVILDPTGLGPPVSLGLKSSLRAETAILGSIEEAIYIRPWMRNEMLLNKKNTFSIIAKDIQTLKQRGLYWLNPSAAKHLNFLLDQKAINFKKEGFTGDTKEELILIKKLLSDKKVETFYANITPFNWKNTEFYFYKVVIPQLQPMFFFEKHPEIRNNRLHQVAKYFNKKNFSINQIPHPFL